MPYDKDENAMPYDKDDNVMPYDKEKHEMPHDSDNEYMCYSTMPPTVYSCNEYRHDSFMQKL